MKKSFLRAALCGAVVCLSFFAQPAFAQRTMSGQYFLSASYVHGVAPEATRKVMGVEGVFGQYNYNGYWMAGMHYTFKSKDVPVGCFTASYGRMFRLLSIRSRIFNVYAGGTIFLGADFGHDTVEEISVQSGYISYDEPEVTEYGNGFVYGIEPRIEGELFIVRKVSLLLGGAVPVKGKTQQDKVSARFYFGLRVNL